METPTHFSLFSSLPEVTSPISFEIMAEVKNDSLAAWDSITAQLAKPDSNVKEFRGQVRKALRMTFAVLDFAEVTAPTNPRRGVKPPLSLASRFEPVIPTLHTHSDCSDDFI